MSVHFLQRCRHACEPFVQRLSGDPQLVILGFNSGANIGDMALTSAVKQFCESRNIRAVCQDLSHLSRWKFYDVPVVVAGGGVLHKDVVAQLAERYEPDRVAIVGVDHWSSKALMEHQSWLREVAYFSSRSARFASTCESVLERPDIPIHPDLVFGFDWTGVPSGHRSDMIGINCLPLYRSKNRGNWRTWISETDPFFEKANTEIKAYDNLVVKLVEKAQSACRRLIHIPFAPEDHIYAIDKLKPLGVDCLSYSASPRRAAAAIRSCKALIATRLHAKIFGYELGVPCIGLKYSQKCIDLDEVINFSGSKVTSQVEYQRHGDDFVRTLFDEQCRLNESRAKSLKNSVHQALQEASYTLNIKTGAKS
jgi:exopolysaccharide biosynthesis predicted pyruvyltransferase EpsI